MSSNDKCAVFFGGFINRGFCLERVKSRDGLEEAGLRCIIGRPIALAKTKAPHNCGAFVVFQVG
jgi:hypothetical protein